MIAKLLISTLAVYFAAYLLPGVTVHGFFSAFLVAIVLGLLNTYLKPVLMILSLPITLLTLGFFALVVNTVMIMLVDSFVSGFEVKTFWWGMLYGLILSLVTSVLNNIFDTHTTNP